MKTKTMLLVLLCSLLIMGGAQATEYKITRLSDNRVDDSLGIHNGQVAWSGFSINSGNYEIFLYDGTKAVQLTDNDHDDRQPFIHNGQVVWSGYDGGCYQIFFYNGSQAMQLTNSNYDNEYPKINNGKVTWHGYDGHDWEVFFYDGARTIQLTNNDYDDGGSDIDNGQVVWEGAGIFLYDGTTITQLTDNGGAPSINNGQVAWSSYDEEIFLYGDGAVRQITGSDLIRDEFAYVNNGQIVWTGEEYYGVPDVANVFFYDGAKTTQLTDYGNSHIDSFGCMLGWPSPIHNGQVAWEGDDGNDQEIFLYDGTRTIQFTDNDYDDLNPNIHNGQVAWCGYDGNGYAIFLATPISGCTLDILNGADFSAGREVSDNPEKLLANQSIMRGVTADGTTRLLLRLNVDQANRVEFSIPAPYNPDEDGILCSIDGTQKGMAIAIDTVQTSSGNVAFAIYQAPKTFARQDCPADQETSERNVSIKVQSLNSPIFEFEKTIKIIRPPVILLHGLWANSTMWSNLVDTLKSQISGIRVYAIDYRDTNAAHLISNEGLLHQEIKNIKKKFRQDGIAMTKADLFGHSMGGVLARVYAGTFGVYKRSDNFYAGDINKLVTIDSPHWGSFLASYAVEGMNIPVAGNILAAIALDYDMPLDMGACEDLAFGSQRIKALERTPTDTHSYVIAGDYQVPNGDLGYIENDQCRILLTILKFIGLDPSPFVIQDKSDLVVPLAYQIAGMPASSTSIYPHDHLNSICADVTKKIKELLNAIPEEPLFNTGFPVQRD